MASSDSGEPEVLIPEVLPPEATERAAGSAEAARDLWKERLRLIRAAALLDLIDFLLRGPFGLRLGFPIGFGVGWLLARRVLGWDPGRCAALGVAAGVYCALPFTRMLPLGIALALFTPLPALSPPARR